MNVVAVTYHSYLVIRLTSVLLAIGMLLPSGVLPDHSASAQQEQRNGAGLVVRHGDGSLIYAYVEFDGESIGGEELLLRSGLDLIMTPYGGLGTAVCAIDGEGCPADNCFCESFGTPAFFWNYYIWSGSEWIAQPRGPTTRTLADGEIDGWSWTADDHGLPSVSIDEIAEFNGFDRSPDPTVTPPPTEEPTSSAAQPVPTATSAADPAPTSNPIEPPTVSPTFTPIATTTPTSTLPVPTTPITATELQVEPAPTETMSATTATSGRSPTSTSTPTALPTEPEPDGSPPTATAGSGAVIVRPDGTPEPVQREPDDGDQRTLLIFGGFVVLVVGFGGFMFVRRWRGEQ